MAMRISLLLLLMATVLTSTADAFSLGKSTRPSSLSTTTTTLISSNTALYSVVLPTPPGGVVDTPESGTIPTTTDEKDNNTSINNINDPPKAGQVARMLPKDSFQVDTATSLFYFAVDFLAVAATMGFLNQVVHSNIYEQAPLLIKAAMVAPLQILTGFAMWCMWCIGHDAGHTTVSKDMPWLNRVVGEVAHSVICFTPFVPWAMSHKKHHVGHNHLERDFSHQWYVREEQDSLHPLIQLSYRTRNLQLPILYFVYLFLGIPDGGHVVFYGRMWEGASLKEKTNAAISVAVSVATAATLWATLGFADFTVVCMIPWCVMSFWLFMVTYLQHHSEDGKVYTDDTFTFERGAFETVDRSYGTWIDRMSHHMMDGHVVHHLFFEKVPHYKLEQATKALRQGLDARGQGHFYKFIDTPDFTQEIVKQFHENWFFVNEKQVVRE